jgi:Bacteriocin-protection, YdeI or OmpD-Associated
MQSILRNCIYEAIEVEESGKKVTFKKVSEYAVPEELQARLDAAPGLRRAFEALTPGRRKSYIFHVSGAKRVKTSLGDRACDVTHDDLRDECSHLYYFRVARWSQRVDVTLMSAALIYDSAGKGH